MATTDKPDKGLKVPFGRQGDRLLAPTNPLAAGLECQCCRPGCGARLIVKQGTKQLYYNQPSWAFCFLSDFLISRARFSFNFAIAPAGVLGFATVGGFGKTRSNADVFPIAMTILKNSSSESHVPSSNRLYVRLDT